MTPRRTRRISPRGPDGSPILPDNPRSSQELRSLERQLGWASAKVRLENGVIVVKVAPELVERVRYTVDILKEGNVQYRVDATRTLSPPQEEYLLRWHFGMSGGSPATFKKLFELDMFRDENGRVVISPKGKAYLDHWHTKIGL